MKPLYEIEATAIGGRDGAVATSDGRLRFNLSIPKELGGTGGDGANPEQFFALGYAACFLTAIKEVARQSEIELAPDANVTATVAVGQRVNGEGLALNVTLAVDLAGLDRKKAGDLVSRAHVICPYSEATRGNLDVKLSVV